MKLTIALMISLAVFCPVRETTAQRSVSGIVSDVFTGEPVEGVSVKSLLSGAETTTSAAGLFVLSIPVSIADTVTFSRIGYREEYIIVTANSAGKNNLHIRMSQDEILSGNIEVNEGRIMTELRYATLPLSVVTESEIKGLPFIAVPNAIQNETGISLLRDGVWANEVSIRGLSRDNVVTLVNGNRIETANNHAGRLALIDLNTVERIELIKGGTSSIYGSGAMG
ncbi:MAG: TonB-dependent receptor, partial [Ignavibacteria bacterium]|nr:TonB-dependent receptor [Ignavibacteria bacterium]